MRVCPHALYVCVRARTVLGHKNSEPTMDEPWLCNVAPLSGPYECLQLVDPFPTLDGRHVPSAFVALPLPPAANAKVLECLQGATSIELAVKMRSGRVIICGHGRRITTADRTAKQRVQVRADYYVP